jgi:hypothetical protein
VRRLAVLYLGRIKQWEKAAALSAAPELPALIEQGNAPKCDSDCGPLRRFPHYFTVRENEEVRGHRAHSQRGLRAREAQR